MTYFTKQLIHGTNYANELEKKTVELGKWTIESEQVIEKDWCFYSKGWHRSHGPKKTVKSRLLTFSKKHGRGRIVKSVKLSSWAGDFLAKSINELGLNKKTSKMPLKIILNRAYDAKLLYKKRGYRIYSRSLLNAHVDYVIKSPGGVVFHADSEGDLILGVHKKIREQHRKLIGVVDYKKAKKLGFCDEGINEFCAVYNLDIDSNYTLSELEQIIRKNIGGAAPFLSELKTLARAFNYQVVEFVEGES